MFFMIGISDDRKDLDYSRMVVCDACGAYGRYSVFMTCTVLSLFFIPCLRWNKKYFVQASCCGSIFELDGDVGRRIAGGEDVRIRPEHLRRVHGGAGAAKRCGSCGYVTNEDFDFCPKCGKRF